MKDIDTDIFNLHDAQPQPQRGSLLLAKPTVGDFFFKRAVIAMVDPDEGNGAMGVVINHYTGYNLRDIMPDIDTVEEIPVYLGGPVGTNMMFYVHTLGEHIVPESIPLADGVYFGGDFDAIKRYLELGQPAAGVIKFIVGYSGWEKGQIASELERHDWAVLPHSTTHLLMADGDDDLWRMVVRQFGERYSLWLNLPSDPSYN